MDSKAIHLQLLASLRAEVRRHWGRISEIESDLGVSDGYLNRLCSGKIELKLETFLRILDVLGADPKAFLARVLDIHAGPEDYLASLEDHGEPDRPFEKIAQATVAFEQAAPPASRGTVAAGPLVMDVVTRSRAEQLRRLRQGKKYRTQAFAQAYLDHLDSLRYDDAEEAAKLVTGVAVNLLPALPGPQSERIRLACRALGIFGSARRSRGRFTPAARAFRLALEMSRRAGLHGETANLLIRASYLLKDFAQFERAMALLSEALVIFVRLGSARDMGRVLVNQGMLDCYLGNYEIAVLDLEQALRHLAGSATLVPRSHLAAYQYLAYAFERLGDLDAAEAALAKGIRTFGSGYAVDRAKLLWLRGTLAFRRGEYQRSERVLRVVGEVLATKEYPGQEAMVALDLADALLAQNKNEEAIQLAEGMAPLLMRFKNNRFAEAAIVELISSALAGRLNQEVVRGVRSKLEKGCTSLSGAPLRD